MTLEMKHCQCVRTHHEFAATFGGQVCDIIRDDICTRKVENLGAYQLCLSRCRVACQETKYDVRLSSLAVDKGQVLLHNKIFVRYATSAAVSAQSFDSRGVRLFRRIHRNMAGIFVAISAA
ncbi:uncharacterized protein LOC119437220 [Dermacentor silvarum]|uniref:uncharacterized protein LOC119437220 n=1 Tax=Dermacentor silvarum TaxID=543639 RepID=UPI002101BE42|nr:uncharacterized protein LOC119437220 [Dermacentor silvarum]